MTDKISPSARSAVMRRVKGKNTSPELRVRQLIFRNGYRYRIHAKELPGTPDIVFRGQNKAISVHGCFWHGHDCKRGQNRPSTNVDYWESKLSRTKKRDIENDKGLRELGWDHLVIWECELKDECKIEDRLRKFIDG